MSTVTIPSEELRMFQKLNYHDKRPTSDSELQNVNSGIVLYCYQTWRGDKVRESGLTISCPAILSNVCECVFVLVGWWDHRAYKTMGRELIWLGLNYHHTLHVCMHKKTQTRSCFPSLSQNCVSCFHLYVSSIVPHLDTWLCTGSIFGGIQRNARLLCFCHTLINMRGDF